MDINALAGLGKIAGIAGIAVGALVLIFSSVIRKNIFPGLTKDQGYKVIRMILMFAGALAFVGIGAWVYLDVVKNAREKEGKLVSRYIVGNVVDEEGKPVVSANIEVSQDNSFLDKSDGNGRFALEVKGMGNKYLDVVVKHKSYVTNREKVKVDFEGEESEIQLKKAIILQNAYPPDQDEIHNDYNRSGSSGNSGNNFDNKADNGGSPASGSGTGSITLKYMGDALDCVLNLRINIGGNSFNPDSNPFTIRNIPLGTQPYSISGYIECGVEDCDATGGGNLYVENSAVYYIMSNYYTCNVGLYSQSDYNRLNGL
jgi:hypothetical protein